MLKCKIKLVNLSFYANELRTVLNCPYLIISENLKVSNYRKLFCETVLVV